MIHEAGQNGISLATALLDIVPKFLRRLRALSWFHCKNAWSACVMMSVPVSWPPFQRSIT